MKTSFARWLAGAAVMALLLPGCSGAERNTSPVEIVATATVDSNVFDIAGSPTQDVATILVRAFQRNPDATGGAFNDVRLTAYRVTYQRTDGGTQTPAAFVVNINQQLAVGGAPQPLNNFVLIDPTALRQAPFAALLPQNGGRDPQTGRTTVQMDVAVEVFGETLAGERVYDFARFPVEFCYGCRGA